MILECWECEGRSSQCAVCQGKNQIPVHRCPMSFVPRAAWQVCEAAILFAEAGVLPVAGGWLEQSATFVDALALVLKERAHYLEERRREAERAAQRGMRSRAIG